MRQIDLFSDLGGEERELLAKRCSWQRYETGELVVSQNDRSTDVYLIAFGRVRVTLYSNAGREVSFRELAAGESFGELSAIDGAARSAHVITLHETMLGTMPAAVFAETLKQHPEVMWAVLNKLTKLVRALSERVFEFATLGVNNRIHAELLRRARVDEQDERGIIDPAPTHAEIASVISTHREAVTREINKLAKDGLLLKGHGRLEVTDMSRLRQMVDEAVGSEATPKS